MRSSMPGRPSSCSTTSNRRRAGGAIAAASASANCASSQTCCATCRRTIWLWSACTSRSSISRIRPIPADTTADRRALLELLARRPHTVSFAGHSHTTEHHYLGRTEGFDGEAPHHHHILTAACGSWWSGPRSPRHSCRRESRDGTPKVSTFYRSTEIAIQRVLSPWGARLQNTDADSGRRARAGRCRGHIDSRACNPVRAPGRSSGDQLPGSSSTSSMADRGAASPTRSRGSQALSPVAMEQVRMCDPFIVELFARNKATCKPWVEPAHSSHIWAAPLPASLRPGAHRIIARAWGEYGDLHVAHAVLEILS